MTDRELLELAAKAAGIDKRCLPHAWPDRFDDDQWDPLIDDGDALRLAVKLDMQIWRNTGNTVSAICPGAPFWERRKEDLGDDPYAATRRAIVRAAADIGGQQP